MSVMSNYYHKSTLIYRKFIVLIFSKVLKKFNLDSLYEGQTKVDGEQFEVEDVDDGPGAFHACLDIGLARTSTGARIFGAMKGAVDGGKQQFLICTLMLLFANN